MQIPFCVAYKKNTSYMYIMQKYSTDLSQCVLWRNISFTYEVYISLQFCMLMFPSWN